MIDDLPAGPVDYPIDKLLTIKREHEAEMASQGHINRRAQLNDEQWAQLLDELQQRLSWDEWQDFTGPLFYGEVPALTPAVHRQLRQAAEWLYSRVWPDGHTTLRESIQQLNYVLMDLLQTFEKHIEDLNPDADLLRTERFYKIDRWDPPLYHELVAEYKYHVDLVCDLAFELTRYNNLVADIIREEIDGSFRFEQGAFTVRDSDGLGWTIRRPEFTAQERQLGEPYRGPAEFSEDRKYRDISALRMRTGARDIPAASDGLDEEGAQDAADDERGPS